MELNNNEYTIACFVDLCKAFDTVNHEILLNKLQHCGLHKNMISWLENYLSQRYQTCFANNVNSTPRLLKCGVPQGSILGPLLFLLHISDIDYNLLNTKLYADDTVIYSTNKDEAVAYGNVERDLKILMKWCDKNRLTINIKKTKLVLFGTREILHNSRHIDMYMGTGKLQYVNDYMYLGIKLDSKFTFELHANRCCRHVIHKNYILAKIRRYINTHQALTIYKSMI